MYLSLRETTASVENGKPLANYRLKTVYDSALTVIGIELWTLSRPIHYLLYVSCHSQVTHNALGWWRTRFRNGPTNPLNKKLLCKSLFDTEMEKQVSSPRPGTLVIS